MDFRPNSSRAASYENLDGISKNASDIDLELNESMAAGINSETTEKTPLEMARLRRQSMKRLVRQNSTVNTQKSQSGAMQLTYWF